MTLYGIDSFEAYLNDCDENHKSVNHLWLNDKFYQAICRFNYKELVDLLARFMAIASQMPNDELGKCLFKLDIAHYVRWKLLGPDFHKFIGVSNRLDVATMLDAMFIHQKLPVTASRIRICIQSS